MATDQIYWHHNGNLLTIQLVSRLVTNRYNGYNG